MRSSYWGSVVEYIEYLCIDRVVCTDPLFLLSWQEVLGQEGSPAQDGSELNALKERVKTL